MPELFAIQGNLEIPLNGMRQQTRILCRTTSTHISLLVIGTAFLVAVLSSYSPIFLLVNIQIVAAILPVIIWLHSSPAIL